MKNLSWLAPALFAPALLALSACKDKGADNSAAAAMQKMEELKTKMCACKDAACAQAVSDDMASWSQEQAKNQKSPPKLSDNDQKRAAALGEQMGKCMQEAMAATATPPAGSGAAGSAGSAAPADDAGSAGAGSGADGLPAECVDYRATVEKLKTCDKIPEKARDALVKAFDDAAARWATLPEGAKAGLSTSCKAGSEAVVAAAKDTCGW